MKKILINLIVITLLFGCIPNEPKDPNETIYSRFSNQTVEGGFDTLISMIAYTESAEDFANYFNMMKNEFYRLHQLFDKYNEYPGINNIYTINKNAGIKPVVVEQEIIDLLLLSKKWQTVADGVFDVTLGAVLKVWHYYRELGLESNMKQKEGAIPSLLELQNAAMCVGFEFIEIDEEQSTVYINDECASLDVGGIAKGYATEIVANKLFANGLALAVINAGGNVRTLGNKLNDEQEEEPWAVGIESPSMGATSVETIRIAGRHSLVTSGDYQRYFVGPDGMTYHHIIHPTTLQPTRYFRSVTMIMEDSGLADILSTILFLIPYEEGVELVHQLQMEYPDQIIGAIWVFDKNQVPHQVTTKLSQGFQIIISDSLKAYSRIFGN